ncbi:porin family protein [Flavihumibacter sp. UBA7668]|uniref:porin family protein n=1 Tax=Flavihumibacter sp. UBA7668 TaxID=1946542 RepID=UPI0025C2EF25|nr:porin family protein [Flavihumibacter sp. UBA7668]
MRKEWRNLAVLFVTAGAIFSTSQLQAQQQEMSGNGLSPRFGVKAGLNLSNFYSDEVNDNNLKAGLNAGVYAKLPVFKGFSIQPELLYSNKGSKRTYDNAVFGEGEYRTNLHYIEMPVLGVINLAKNFNIHAGPYVSYLAGANITDLESDGSVDEIADLNPENLNRFDYGLAAGFGIDLGPTTIGARYTLGMREVGKSGSIAGEAFRDTKNSNISLFIGVGF